MIRLLMVCVSGKWRSFIFAKPTRVVIKLIALRDGDFAFPSNQILANHEIHWSLDVYDVYAMFGNQHEQSYK